MTTVPVQRRRWRLPSAEDLRVSVVTGRGALRNARLAGLVVAVAVVAGVGLSTDSSAQYSLTIGIVYAVAILGGNLVIGALGEVNLATGASMAVGAYTFIWLDQHGAGGLLGIVLAGVGAGVVGSVLAVPTVRLTGVFTALVTFALAFAVPDLIVELDPVTGGQAGTAPVLNGTILGLDPYDPADLLVLCSVVFLVLAGAVVWVFSGRIGRTVVAVGEARRAAESFGIRSTGWAVAVWTASAVLCGISGALLAMLVGFMTPSVFPVLLSITLLVGSFAGGVRSPLGALLGGLLVGTVPPNIQSVIPASATSLALGLVLLVVLVTGGAGLGGGLERLGTGAFARLRRTR